MPSPSSTPDLTPPFASPLATMDSANRSGKKHLSPALRSSRSLRGVSDTPVPESSQERVQGRKTRLPSLRRPQSVVTVIIGPEESNETFIIHKDIICHHSSYFANAFNSKHLESKTQTITIPEVNSDTFGILVEWLYTQKIDIDLKDHDGNILLLSQLWTLAQRFGVPNLQNNIMDGLRPLVECTEGEALKNFLHYAYEAKGTTMLQRLATDRMAWATSANRLEVWMSGGHLPQALLVDIIMSLKKDHVHGLEPTMKFGSFGSAKEYYVGDGEAVVVPKEEKQ
ncbi:hypothetical protein ONS95_005162 [Cadophora gregata]|uniref:uncharacterized protein n=1 Tax=Cadophora gregata TaxID=51156 RepID=UPI0026DBC2F3|nr:uncharacterized protein ONS95_005162 [Cadophora gregata]KAK0104897.1 hypothetical protein ONS95_005162 [Cadophora gregata]KAK0115024.1 hypothetical protein ONS96_013494 [Cadophora gregata f. sp. sojae]